MTAFTLARREVPSLIVQDEVRSTNSELVALASAAEVATFTTVVTMNQTAGRGRLDRVWVAPPRTSLAISVLVRPPVGGELVVEAGGWLPLAAGVAMHDAIRSVAPGLPVGIKWPNDVQIEGRKVCGILCEVIEGGSGVVIGAGLNVSMSPAQLPAPTATSLVIAGAPSDDELYDRVLAAYLAALRSTLSAFWADGGDAQRSGLRAAVMERCTTLGRSVRVELPGGSELLGTAVSIDSIGRLEVEDGSGRVHAIAAGDIVHLR
ncbi:biotin--[acetyl-CoA-carboxylase] ligase [Lysinimonas soli]|uniref:biotin--[biotin carboxyl-carrier protein] ligase n=1 Tax=Lysinimonas soli TaxID=1074233 RepID=A0ABW0NSC9_9MICO